LACSQPSLWAAAVAPPARIKPRQPR
jgi:hypothetical protein